MKKDIFAAAVAIVIVGGICFGLAAVRPDLPPTPSQPFTPAAGTAAKKKVGANETVVMRVNGEPITEREFNAFLTQAPAQMQPFYASPQGRRMLADELVKLKALEQEAARLGLENDPETSTRIDMMRTNILAGMALRKLVGAADDKKLRAEYEKERGNLETVELSHILIAYQGGQIPPRTGQAPPLPQAMAKAMSLMARLKAGADFAQLASRESDDVNTAREGGSLGPVGAGALPQELEGPVMTLQPGQISDPLRSQFGIHIFKAGQRSSQPFEQLREALAARVERQEAEAAVIRLSQSAKVDLDPKFFPAETPRRLPGAPGAPPQAPRKTPG